MNTGLDPEILTIDGDGYIVPASYFLDPPKRDAKGVLNDISYDNAAIEIRPEESEDLDILALNTDTLLHRATVSMRLARRRQKIPPGSELSLIPSAPLHPKIRYNKSVSSFGCSPSQTVGDDYGVFTTKLFCSPGKTLYRSAGFHIHQELSHHDTEQPAVAVLDGLLGLVDVQQNHKLGWSKASRIRRNGLGYGRAGEHRVRKVPSGQRVLEYRVMSPWPLADDADIMWTTATVKAVCECSLNTLLDVLDEFPDRPKITKAINRDDHMSAKELRGPVLTAWAGR